MGRAYAEWVDRWTCPDCGREFGRRDQSHMCAPGLTVEEYFKTAQAWERPVFDVVAAHLEGIGEVIIDPIAVGIQFKNGPVFCMLRPMKRWTALGFTLRRRLDSDKLSRKVTDGGAGKFYHVINVDDPLLVDAEVLGWLTEAYHIAGGTEHLLAPSEASGDGMVPDDVEDLF